MRTAVKARKESDCDTPASPKAVAKAKAAKTKEAALKGVCGNKKTKSHTPSPHGSPRHRCPKGHPNSLEERSLQKRAWLLHCHRVLPDHRVSHEDRGQHPHGHWTWGQPALVRQAVRKAYDPDPAKVNILIRPDGEQKPDVPLVNVALCMLPTELGSSKGVQLTNSTHKIFTIKKK